MKSFTKESGRTKPLLDRSPLHEVQTGGIQTKMSNISGDSGPGGVGAFQTEDPALMAYKKYKDPDVDSSSKSSVSFVSQDTFTTYGHGDLNRVQVWSGRPLLPKLGCLNLEWTWAEQFVKSRAFKRISICFIILNCILAAIATSDWVMQNSQRLYYFDLAKEIFVYIMSVELFLQFLTNGVNFFSNGWLVFDFVFIGLAWIVPNLLVVRTFRVVRTLRLASWVKDLKELVIALLLVIPKMFAIFFLLAILFLIFSILFTDLFKHTYDDGITQEDYFSRIDITLFTLFQIMTLDGWAEICKEIMEEHPWAWAPFVCFVVVSSFFFLNLVIAVVCDAVTSVHKETVVKYIQDDISAATSVREALKVEDRLEELASSIQLMMQAQITVLEGLQVSKGAGESVSTQQEDNRRKVSAALKAELESTFFGKRNASELTPVTKNGSGIPQGMGDDDISDVSGPKPFPKIARLKEPTSADFWNDSGLTADQIAKVVSRLKGARSGPQMPDLGPRPEAMNEGTSQQRNSDSHQGSFA